MSPQDYKQASSEAERRRIQTAVFWEYKARVAKLVRAIVPQRSREDGEQVGALGLIVALEKYDAAKNNCFWAFALPHVRNEIQKWLDHGVYWRPRSRKVRDAEKEKLAKLQRHCASMDAILPSGESLHDLIATIAPSVEEVLSEADIETRLMRFALTLAPKDSKKLFSENSQCVRSRRYLDLVEEATNFVKADPSDAPVLRIQDSTPTASSRGKRNHKASQ